MTIAALLLTLAAQQPAEPPALRAGLEPLAFLAGHCWRGELPTGETDTHCFEPVYGGQHLRDRHEVTGGEGAYAGETFYSAEGSGGIGFTYFNSHGGVSRGTMRAAADGRWATEERYRGADGQEIVLTVTWGRDGTDGYRVVTASEDAPAMNGTVVYRRVDAPVTVSEEKAIDGSLRLVHETVVDAPVEQVWGAIATAEGWTSWAVPVAWAPEPDVIETSYDPSAEPGGPQTIRQRVLARVPGRMIAFRTVKAPEGFPHFEIFGRTTGVFELEPEGEGRTRIRTIGAGYPDDEAGRQLIGFFRQGNEIVLKRLQRRFTDGPVDWSAMADPERD